jgi:WD40 repeat protein
MVHLALGWCYKDKLYVGDDVEQVDYSSNGDYLVIGRSDNQVDLYYTANLTKKCSYTDTVNINYIKFTPNGDAFALCRDASAVRFIKTSDCSLRGTLASGHVNVHGIDFDYTGTRILTCGDDESFKIWDYGFVRTAGGFATG